MPQEEQLLRSLDVCGKLVLYSVCRWPRVTRVQSALQDIDVCLVNLQDIEHSVIHAIRQEELAPANNIIANQEWLPWLDILTNQHIFTLERLVHDGQTVRRRWALNRANWSTARLNSAIMAEVRECGSLNSHVEVIGPSNWWTGPNNNPPSNWLTQRTYEVVVTVLRDEANGIITPLMQPPYEIDRRFASKDSVQTVYNRRLVERINSLNQ